MSESMASPQEQGIERFSNVTTDEIEHHYHTGPRPLENSAGAAA